MKIELKDFLELCTLITNSDPKNMEKKPNNNNEVNKSFSYPEPVSNPEDSLRYAIVRSRDQGCVCGYIQNIQGRTVTVLKARQIFTYDCSFTLPDLAEKGMRHVQENQLSCEMSDPLIMLEACGVLFCSEKGKKDLLSQAAEVH